MNTWHSKPPTRLRQKNETAGESNKVMKKHKISDQGAVASKPSKRFSVVARYYIQMELVDETSSRSKPVVRDWGTHVSHSRRSFHDEHGGLIPRFDSAEEDHGYHAIKCDDQFLLYFLINSTGKIQNSWGGLKPELISASETPRKPSSRIQIANMKFQAHSRWPTGRPLKWRLHRSTVCFLMLQKRV